jgi:hypothetical protein
MKLTGDTEILRSKIRAVEFDYLTRLQVRRESRVRMKGYGK